MLAADITVGESSEGRIPFTFDESAWMSVSPPRRCCHTSQPRCPANRTIQTPAADANLVTSLSMVLPLGPSEKQALLEAADSTARAKLLVAFLEMNAFGDPSDTPPGRTN